MGCTQLTAPPCIGPNPVDDTVLVKVRDLSEGEGCLEILRHTDKVECGALIVVPLLSHLKNSNIGSVNSDQWC